MGRNGTRGLSRPGARVLSLTAALALAATVFPAKAALARADGQEVDALVAQAEEAAMAVQAGEAIPVTEDTHSMSSGTYLVKGTVTISPDETGNAIRIEPGSSVNLVLSVGSLLRVTGADAEGAGVGHAAILLPESSSLYVTGGGRLFATGGRAGDGCCGGDAEKPRQYYLREMYSDKYYYDMRVGEGGAGGQGGGGAGAGIGTDGGAGGAGGCGGNAIMSEIEFGGPTEAAKNHYGHDGYAGGAGSASAPAGTLTVMGDAKVVATGGAAAEAGGPGGRRGEYLANYGRYNAALFEVAGACGTSGGAGGGAGGSAADGIGSGGTGGSGGGGGASGNYDGEALGALSDLDDLWSYGGHGGQGTSSWGGPAGSEGDYGANGGDDTDASREYARSGGAGGPAGPDPRAVPFYTYREHFDSNPEVRCTSGHGVSREAVEQGGFGDGQTNAMLRLYNPNSGEHFYTSDTAERDHLVELGWNDEGVGWLAPAASSTPVYRLYNSNVGEHHYTTDDSERDTLVAAGWTDEGIGWYSYGKRGVPLYREYNPNQFSCNHNYTVDWEEHEHLLSLGWVDEGVGWYGVLAR